MPNKTSAPNKAVAIVSGGMDSVTLAYLLAEQGYTGDRLHLLSFDYGQRHKRELDCAKACARRLGARHDVIDLRSVGALLTGSSLTDENVDVPDGHYAAETMKATVVPNRNAIMLACAFGIAIADGAEIVATGVHAGDHFIYPDCRPMFISALDIALRLGNDGFMPHGETQLYAPFSRKTKTDIARIGHGLNVPYPDTWSCYKGGAKHCGSCGTCYERREAFREAGITDLTEYEATPHFDAPTQTH